MRFPRSLFFVLLALVLPLAARANSRVKDLALVEGGRDNQLVGYGIVMGLAGDGDKNSEVTLRSIANAMQRFGITVERHGFSRFTIPAGSHYRSPGSLHVEADASSASYFVALGAIAGRDGPVRIEGVGLDSIQGDIRFVEAARLMGAQVEGGPAHLSVRRGAWPLKAITLDCNHIPDAAMTLAVSPSDANCSHR